MRGVGTPSVLLLGRAGLTRDIIGHVLAQSGYDTLDLDHLGADPDAAIVTVLVSPTPADWRAAARLQARTIVIVDGEPTADDLVQLVMRGASAVLDSSAELSDVIAAIDAVAEDGAMLSPAHLGLLLDRLRRDAREILPAARLTERELDILLSIERGEAVKQTAKALGIAEKTVQNLQSRLFRKLGARNRAQVIARAHELGLLNDLVSN